MMEKHILEGDSIDFAYGTHTVLSGVYLRCETGKVTGLLGRNGAGKSTLFNILFGTARSKSGSVRWNARYIERAFTTPGLISYMPQHPCIPEHFTLKKLTGLFGADPIDPSDAIYVDLLGKLTNTPLGTLSTGERKLLEAILFLHSKRHFVLLDEPFSFLSPLQIEALVPMILKQAQKKGILLTDHRYQHVIDISDEVLLLKHGAVRPVQGIEGLKDAGYAS